MCLLFHYQSLYQVAASLGCEVSNWTAEEGATWIFDVDRLEKLIQKLMKTRTAKRSRKKRKRSPSGALRENEKRTNPSNPDPEREGMCRQTGNSGFPLTPGETP